MGFTRARRYANYKGGQNYAGEDHHELERGTGDPQTAESAAIFYERWKAAEATDAYASAKAEWKKRHG
jgi:hypothetical protein